MRYPSEGEVWFHKKLRLLTEVEEYTPRGYIIARVGYRDDSNVWPRLRVFELGRFMDHYEFHHVREDVI